MKGSRPTSISRYESPAARAAWDSMWQLLLSELLETNSQAVELIDMGNDSPRLNVDDADDPCP